MSVLTIILIMVLFIPSLVLGGYLMALLVQLIVWIVEKLPPFNNY